MSRGQRPRSDAPTSATERGLKTDCADRNFIKLSLKLLPPHRLSRFFQTRYFFEFGGAARPRQSSSRLAMGQMKGRRRRRLPGRVR